MESFASSYTEATWVPPKFIAPEPALGLLPSGPLAWLQLGQSQAFKGRGSDDGKQDVLRGKKFE